MPIIRRDWGNINTRLEEETNSSGGGFADKRMFKPKFSKDGTFSALIRFLPAPGDEIPMVKTFTHRFKGKGGELNETCPTTVGEQCPICEKNREMWDSDPDTVRRRSRQKAGIANILVINDPQVPANNGKVFLYRFGKRILDKINSTVFPDDKLIKLGATAINVFDYFEGANFQLIGQKTTTGGQTFPEYTQSKFNNPSPLGATASNPKGDEALMEAVEAQLHSLQEFVSKDKVKSYQKLDEIFNKVLGGASLSPQAPAQQAPQAPAPQAPAPQAPQQSNAPSAPVIENAPVESGLSFDDAGDQNEDEFWNSIKNNK